MDVEGDRLSSLPDDIIHIIFSFISIKDAIGTSVLSSRWRFIWTSTPHLNFENLNSNNGPRRISKLISKVMSHRNNQTQVSSVNLVLGRAVRDDESVRRILFTGFSHNVQQVSVTRLPMPPNMHTFAWPIYSFVATPKRDLTAITTLHLHHIIFQPDYNNVNFFSKCSNLKNLFLKRCTMNETNVLNICHLRLSNLTLENTEVGEVVNVVAPQLKNLTIKRCQGKHVISAPGLTSLLIEGFQPWQLSTTADFHSLEKVQLYMYDTYNADARKIACLLQQLRGAKLLILNLGILQCLFSQSKPRSSAMKLNPHKACAFDYAKIIKFIPNIRFNVYLEVRVLKKVTTTSSEVKNYDALPSAIFPMITHQEIIAMEDIESAQIFVDHFRRLLKQCKANTNSAHVDEPQDEMQWARILKWNLGKMMEMLQHRKIVQLETCGLVACFRQRYIGRRLETRPIIAWLQEMHALFERNHWLITYQLSTSKRDVMQPVFLSLCEDAAILTNNMLRWMQTAK